MKSLKYGKIQVIVQTMIKNNTALWKCTMCFFFIETYRRYFLLNTFVMIALALTPFCTEFTQTPVHNPNILFVFNELLAPLTKTMQLHPSPHTIYKN